MDRFEATKSPPPSSALLQDLLREKRATQNSPLTSKPVTMPTTERSAKHKRQSSGFKDKGPVAAEMGMREMDDYINKIKKENIDLKFELFHRRQRDEEIERKLEKMEVLEGEMRNCQANNEELLRELEKRDAAVKEAVNLIYDLEGKVEFLKSRERIKNAIMQSPPTASVDSNGDLAERTPTQTFIPSESHRDGQSTSQMVTQIEDIVLPSTPSPQHEEGTDNIAERVRSPWRTPSFLREQKENTQALRSLYKGNGNNLRLNPSFLSLSPSGSLYTMDDEYDRDPDCHTLNSPRLSVLSESSLFSVYGKPKKLQAASPQKIDRIYDGSSSDEESDSQKRRPQERRQNEAEIRKWIDDKNKQTSPSRKPQKDIDKFSSIDEVLDKAPVPSRARRTGQSPPVGGLSRKTGRDFPRKDEEDFYHKDGEAFSRKNDEETLRKKGHDVSRSLGGPIFGQNALPPTPDTMSTDHREADMSTPNIITERSLANGASFRPDRLHYDIPAYHQIETSTRPQLGSYATNIMFNGYDESKATQPIQPTRTMSYPSPTEGKHRRSVQFSPVGNEASEPTHARTSDTSPQKQMGGNYDTTTPTPTPTNHRPESRLPQPSTMRLKNLFRRSNSHSTQSTVDYTDSSPARPSSRNVSSPQPRRPSSIHLANTSKPLPDPNAPSRIGRSASAKMKDSLRGIQIRR